jgi:Cof subfamily protein (haloacid dehalogenase superfamily)
MKGLAMNNNELAELIRLIDSMPFLMASFDMDDTMLGPKKRISCANRAAVRALRQLGLLLVPCTGRIYQHTLTYYQSLRLQGPIVASDGALVRIPGGKIIQEIFLCTETAATLRAAAKAHKISTLTHARAGIFANRQDFWDKDADRHRLELGSCFRFVQPEELTQLPSYKVVCSAEPEALDSFAGLVKGCCAKRVQFSRQGPTLLEFTASGVDKVSGLIAVAREYNIDLSQIMAFGDGVNDATTLKAVGLGVAMNHGRDAAKEAADLVAPKTSPETNFAAGVTAVLKIIAAYNRVLRNPTAVAS